MLYAMRRIRICIWNQGNRFDVLLEFNKTDDFSRSQNRFTHLCVRSSRLIVYDSSLNTTIKPPSGCVGVSCLYNFPKNRLVWINSLSTVSIGPLLVGIRLDQRLLKCIGEWSKIDRSFCSETKCSSFRERKRRCSSEFKDAKRSGPSRFVYSRNIDVS